MFASSVAGAEAGRCRPPADAEDDTDTVAGTSRDPAGRVAGAEAGIGCAPTGNDTACEAGLDAVPGAEAA